MKTKFRHNILLGLMFITALFSLVPTSVFASGESVYLTPASGTTQPGNTFTVNVDGYVGSNWWGGGASSSSGSISFPANLLKVVSTSTTDSSFTSSTITPNNTAGTLTFSQSVNWWQGPTNQTVHLFSITFQSLANGTASVQFGTTQYSTGTAATTGGTYTIATPAPSPSPSPTPTPKASTKPVATKAATPTPTPTPVAVEETPAPVVESDGGLKIENVKVTATRSENSVAWSLNNPAATPTLQFGTNKNNLDDAGAVPQLDDGSYKYIFDNLKPGTLYYFTIRASTNDNLSGASYSGVLTTRGYPVQLKIEQGNLLVPGAKVTINKRSFVANNEGIITTELSNGLFNAEITTPGDSTVHKASFTVKKVTIPANGNPATQNFTLNIGAVDSPVQNTSGSPLPMIIGGIIGAIVLIGGAAGFAFFMKRKPREQQTQSVDVDTGQLREAYGANVEKYMTNTPAPNLEGGYAAAQMTTAVAAQQQADSTAVATPPTDSPQDIPLPAYSDSPTVVPPVATEQPPLPPMPQAVTAPPATESPQAAAPYPEPAAQQYAQDPSLLQPSIDQQQAQEQAPMQVAAPSYSAPEPAAPSEDDITQQELAKVESSEPSAVYDVETGELNIIHHHPDTPAQPAVSGTYAAAEQLPTPNMTQSPLAPQASPQQGVTP